MKGKSESIEKIINSVLAFKFLQFSQFDRLIEIYSFQEQY